MKYMTLIITESNLPKYEVSSVHCGNCGRKLMVVKGKLAAMMNSMGLGPYDLPTGVGYIEHKCHSCKTMNRILFQ